MIKPDRQTIYDKFHGHCAYCGDPIHITKMQVDHIICKANFEMTIQTGWKIPVFLRHLTIDDLNHIDNLFPSCGFCNNWKNGFDIETFREELGEQINRLKKQSANYRMAKRYGQVMEMIKPIVFYFELIEAKEANK